MPPTETDIRLSESLSHSVVRAIVHLNFNEPEKALETLLLALSVSNFTSHRKEPTDGHRLESAA